MTREEALNKAINIVSYFEAHFAKSKEAREDLENIIEVLEQEPCEMTAEDYRQRMIQAFHNADCDELIAVCVLPTEKEFEHLEWLLKNHYKKEPCEDAISRKELLKAIYTWDKFGCDADTKLVQYRDHYIPYIHYDDVVKCIKGMPSVNPQNPKTGHCKDCKYFEYDSVAKIDGIPLIVAHEICKRWGDGCKTKEDGYCFLFEPQESEEEE